MKKENSSGGSRLPFGKKNYLIFGLGVALMLLGYFLMSTENFVDATKFSLSLYVCPFLIVGGLVVVAYSILAKSGIGPDSSADNGTQN